jgi:hypothetical protein
MRALILACSAAFALLTAGCATPPAALRPAAMNPSYETHETLRAIVADVTHHIDAKRWTSLEALYADEVATDYSSLFGGQPQTQTRSALIGGWRQVLANMSTQHLLGPINLQVDGATAVARCHVRALHLLPGAPAGEQWEVLGH